MLKSLRASIGILLTFLALAAKAQEDHSQRYRIYNLQNGVAVAQGNMGQPGGGMGMPSGQGQGGMMPSPSGRQGGMKMPPPPKGQRPQGGMMPQGGQGGMKPQSGQGQQDGMRMPQSNGQEQ